MSKAAEKAGAPIVVSSGFRSYDAQAFLYEQGATTDNDGNENIAKPGYSEHQLGTTVDMTSPEVNNVSASSDFDETNAYEWLVDHAHEYGFVMSYPEGKATGYIYEPWHFRYIGLEEAKEIKSSGDTIQEYLENS